MNTTIEDWLAAGEALRQNLEAERARLEAELAKVNADLARLSPPKAAPNPRSKGKTDAIVALLPASPSAAMAPAVVALGTGFSKAFCTSTLGQMAASNRHGVKRIGKRGNFRYYRVVPS